ncbi:MarR family transcriptional regulator [Candidatus Thorarchaeota archaeon]|nr:MAG: MarR family transcriptional regulator [Candidatus Thorarchaeota archaeon]
MTISPGRTPKSAIAILGVLINHGPMCPLEISEKLDMAPRTVSFALRKLLGRQLLRKIPNLHDMRRPKYHVDMDAAKDILQHYSDSALKSHASPFAWQQKL